MADGFGKYEVYATTQSIYCYTGANILRNRYGIRDNVRLKQVEEDLATARQLELTKNQFAVGLRHTIFAAFIAICSERRIPLRGITAAKALQKAKRFLKCQRILNAS